MIVFFRAVLLYLITIFAVRLMGKRQLGELQPSELVTTILISNIAALPIEDTAIPMASGAIPILTLVAFELLVSNLTLRCKKLRTLLSGRPVVLIRKGVLDQQAMKKIRFSVDDLLESLRGSGIFDLDDVWYAVVETNGKISVLEKYSARTVTAEMADLKGKDIAPPAVIISDGQLLHHALKEAAITEEWVANTLRREKLRPEQIFLMTVDGNRHHLILPKEIPEKEGRP